METTDPTPYLNPLWKKVLECIWPGKDQCHSRHLPTQTLLPSLLASGPLHGYKPDNTSSLSYPADLRSNSAAVVLLVPNNPQAGLRPSWVPTVLYTSNHYYLDHPGFVFSSRRAWMRAVLVIVETKDISYVQMSCLWFCPKLHPQRGEDEGLTAE